MQHRPRLLAGNGPAYLSGDLANFLKAHDMTHMRGKPFHPQTQGKIEHNHRSIKNVICLENLHFPWEWEQVIGEFVDDYNRRLHEALLNLTSADANWGAHNEFSANVRLMTIAHWHNDVPTI